MVDYEVVVKGSLGEEISVIVTCQDGVEQSDDYSVLVDSTVSIQFECPIVSVEEQEIKINEW